MKTILIVEDNKEIVSFLKQGLEEEGYGIFVGTNGIDGLKLFKKNTIDLILLDWMMPNMSGLEFCKEIRLINATVPIIFLTAKDTTEDVILGLKSGANDYIKKPFSFDELLERIKIHFRSDSDIISLANGSILVNFAKREVYEQNILINLTKREYDLLIYLINKNGKICTRDEIIQNIWDIHFQYDSGVIDVYINALRKKIETLKSQNLIKPIRGVGYIFNDELI